MSTKAVIVLFLTLLQLALAGKIKATERHEPTISECAAKGGECDETKGRPVCGTDDRTYPTRCHLMRVQCSGHQVSLKYRGPCKACKEALDYALRHKFRRPPKFLPRCNRDGTYAPVQCLANTGCWCSDLSGKPIENTSVRIGRPKCAEYRRANRRRSPTHLSNMRRACSLTDRVAFNEKLMNVIHSEYNRLSIQKQQKQQQQQQQMQQHVESNMRQQVVLDWKFAQLDANANLVLDKSEYRELKKLVKRAVKPRRCGRAFGKLCDINGDERLSRTEWHNCLTKDIHYVNNNATGNEVNIGNNESISSTQVQGERDVKESLGGVSDNSKQTSLAAEQDSEDTMDENDEDSSQLIDYNNDYDDTEESTQDNEDGLLTLGILNARTGGRDPFVYLNAKQDTSGNESESETDCLVDRAAALEEQNHGGTILYVPECTEDRRYKRVQCYRSTPYCWCVDEDTGKHITGTSVKHRYPQCDKLTPRPIKGCPEPRRSMFLKELKDFLKTDLLTGMSMNENTTTWNSEEEAVATMSFVFLDKNKNKSWERKEWKAFRDLITTSKALRKCGKKLPRYCDVNGDKRITLSEWLECTKPQMNELTTTEISSQNDEHDGPKTSRRIGFNPLEQYLKD